jgi:chromate reductase
MKIFAFAASLRRGSYNRKLIAQAAALMRAKSGVEVDLADFREFEMPMYDGDLEETSGIPSGGQAFIKRIESCDAMVISTPEYNGGIPGTLKNAIDWASRQDPIPFDKKPILLIGASPGGLGAVRSLWHTRTPLETIGGRVYPEMFGLQKAHQAFDETGQFTDAKNGKRLDGVLTGFVDYALRLTRPA